MLAVVGHVEWVDFVRAGRLPRPGEIADAHDAWEAPAGGGAMAACALRSLTGAATFFCAVGDDARAQATVSGLRAAGLDVHAAVRPGRAQRRTLTWLTDDHERTITTLAPPLDPRGEDAVPWLSLRDADGVVVFAGDVDAVRAARAARTLVATARVAPALRAAGVAVDALIGSASDPGERIDEALVAACRPRWIVETEGAAGGAWRAGPSAAGDLNVPPASGRWAAAPLPGPPVDTFGCGDAFAAALMAGLASDRDIAGACALAARVGVALLCERAPGVGDLGPLWV
jgi:ribokinase